MPSNPTKRGPGRPRRTDTVRKVMQVPNQFHELVVGLAAAKGCTHMDAILYHILPRLDTDLLPVPAEASPPVADGDDGFLEEPAAVVNLGQPINMPVSTAPRRPDADLEYRESQADVLPAVDHDDDEDDDDDDLFL